MEKVEIDNFFCLIWDTDIWIFFSQKCLFNIPLCFIFLLSKSLNLISCQGDKKGEFLKKKKIFFSETIRWMMLGCQGHKKGEFLKKKNLLLRNHKTDDADYTLHIC